MGVLGRTFSFAPRAGETRDPNDPRWWSSSSGATVRTQSGQYVNADVALRVATVYAAVRVLGTTFASLPLDVYKRTKTGKRETKEVWPAHPIYDLLRHKPNAFNTSYQWRYGLLAHLMLRGNGYARIEPGRRGFVDQLYPIHPDAVQPEYSPGNGTWRDATAVLVPAPGSTLRYRVRQGADGQDSDIALPDDRVFHMRGMSLNGLVGLSVIRLMRETVGMALAAQQYAAGNFLNGARLSGVVTFPQGAGPTTKEQRDEFREQWQAGFGGGANAGKTPVLTGGAKYQTIAMTPEDLDWLGGQGFLVEEFLRFCGIPGVLVGHADKTATYASSEAFFQAFKTYAVLPWCVNFESQANVDLLLDPRSYFVEFNLDALFRPDAKTRAEVARALVELGVMTRNEVRAWDNLNPLPGLDEPLTPLNMSRGTDSPAQDNRPAPPSDPPAQDERRRQRRDRRKRERDGGDALADARRREAALRARLGDVVHAAAARVVRKELEAIKRWAPRFAADAEGWRAWVRDQYGDRHAALVVDALRVGEGTARRYCAEQQALLLEQGVADVESWATTRTEALAGLAMGA